MFRRYRRTAAVAASGIALCLPACMAGDDSAAAADPDAEIHLSYAFFAPAASFPAVQMEEWADRLSERTGGQVSVETYPGGTLLSSGDIYDGVSAGAVDVGLDSPAYDSSRFPMSSVINQPIGIESSAAGSRTFLDLLLEFEPQEFDGYQVISAFTTEPSYLQTETPVDTMADLSGTTLRSSGATIPTLESIGASPLSLSMADVAENLQTGVIDGYVSSREVLRDFALAEQVGYVTDYPLGISNSFVAVMDQEEFDALPEDIREEILNLREEMTVFASEYHDGQNIEDTVAWAAEEHAVQNVAPNPAMRQELDASMEQLAEEWVAEHDGHDFDARQVLDRMQELADEHAETPGDE